MTYKTLKIEKLTDGYKAFNKTKFFMSNSFNRLIELIDSKIK